MDIRFIHDINKNYMIIKRENSEKENYKVKMLQENNIEGLLLMKQKFLDSQERLFYDISSKQSMLILYENSKIKLEDLRQVILELEVCINSLKNYLLDFNDIVLDPRMIFLDIKTLKYSFCYYPYNNGDFRGQLREYLNFVITKIDHSDMETLNLAYELQKITGIENFVIKDLTDLLKSPEPIKKTETVPKEIISYEIPYVNKKLKVTEKVLEKITLIIFVIGILLWFYIFSKTDNENLKKVILVVIPAISIYLGYLFYKNRKKFDKEFFEAEKVQEIIPETEEEDSDNEECLTVYLGDSVNSSFRYFKNLSDASMDFKVESFPIVIGKMESKSDVVIKDLRVSRMHAEIYFENNEYLIADLNSTNGTFINEERLAPYEKNILKPGDLVRISEIAYKFV